MKGLFRNREIKNIVIISVLLAVVFGFISSWIINYSFNKVSSNYAMENIQLAGVKVCKNRK